MTYNRWIIIQLFMSITDIGSGVVTSTIGIFRILMIVFSYTLYWEVDHNIHLNIRVSMLPKITSTLQLFQAFEKQQLIDHIALNFLMDIVVTSFVYYAKSNFRLQNEVYRIFLVCFDPCFPLCYSIWFSSPNIDNKAKIPIYPHY